MELIRTLQLFLVIGACVGVWTQETFYSCPPVDSGTVGECVESCSADSDCPNVSRCCYNGCGHTCMDPISIPYHTPSLVCPEPTDDVAEICSEQCDNCTQGQLCCSNGCGHVCKEGVVPESPCGSLRDSIMDSGLMGAYVPQCEGDGTFSVVQCHSSTGYCWCVSEDTGIPVSDMVRFQMPQCNCTYNEQFFSAGDVFLSVDEDSCDICSCTLDGGVRCIYRDCAEVGVSIFYSCPAVRAGASDHCEADCLLHSECPSHLKCCYNGCGYSCMQPHQIPYIDLSPAYTDTCPAIDDVPCRDEDDWDEEEEEEWSEESDREFGSCRDEDFLCDSDEMCCDNECDSAVCLRRDLDSPCLAAVALSLNGSSSEGYGRYRPLCTTQGLFRGIQCHAHFCWCVEADTGVPLSDIVPFEQANVLACAACVYNGRKYRHLQSFPAGDGCNTCTCIGGTISCSGVDCEVDYEYEDDEMWEWWHSVLIGCVVVVVVLVSVVLILLVGIMVLMKQNNPHRHHRLKEHNSEDCELVEYRNGGQDPESVELKVPPVEDNLLPKETDMADTGPAHA